MDIINFDFEEVNSAVFRNAEIYIRKKNKKDKIGVIVPYQFKALFSNADIVVVLGEELCKQFDIDKYRNVLEYGFLINDKNLISKIKKKIVYEIIKLSKFFGKNFSFYTYRKLYVSARQRKFFVENGLEKYCIEKLRTRFDNFKYMRVGSYVNIQNFSVESFNLGKYFNKRFIYLSTMIKDGKLYHSGIDKKTLMKFFSQSIISKYQDEYLNNFIFKDVNIKKIILRTRNFKNKAVMHNSKFETFKKLAEELIAKNVMVLNIGCPLLNLNIRNNLYCEIEHNLPFEAELKLCQIADSNVMTAEAGLFVGFAASLISITQIDEEWSANNLEKPVYLFKARENFGLRDIDIRNLLINKRYNLAAEKIMENLDRSEYTLKSILENRNLSLRQREIII